MRLQPLHGIIPARIRGEGRKIRISHQVGHDDVYRAHCTLVNAEGARDRQLRSVLDLWVEIDVSVLQTLVRVKQKSLEGSRCWRDRGRR